jgi:thioredoxin-related protein
MSTYIGELTNFICIIILIYMQMKRFLFILCISVLSCSSQVQIELINNNLFVDSKKTSIRSKQQLLIFHYQ